MPSEIVSILMTDSKRIELQGTDQVVEPIEGSRSEGRISSMMCSRDTPFWLETLAIQVKVLELKCVRASRARLGGRMSVGALVTVSKDHVGGRRLAWEAVCFYHIEALQGSNPTIQPLGWSL